MTGQRAKAPAQTAEVLRLPVRPAPGPMGALLTLARYRAAWLRANPNATADEELAAAAEIAKELGL